MSVVLIVEDDADLLAALSDGLEEEGWTVIEADSVPSTVITRLPAK